MKSFFTVEEINLISIYTADTKQELIRSITDALPFIDDGDMRRIAQDAIGKLNALSDDEYARLDFTPDEDGE